MAWISSWTSLTVLVFFFPPVVDGDDEEAAAAAFRTFSSLPPFAATDADALPSSTCTLNCKFRSGPFVSITMIQSDTFLLSEVESLFFSEISSHLPPLERLAAVDA